LKGLIFAHQACIGSVADQNPLGHQMLGTSGQGAPKIPQVGANTPDQATTAESQFSGLISV
jgi:hypothetical protein